MKKKLSIILLTFITLGGATFAYFHKAPPEMKFRPVHLDRGSIQVTVSASGDVEPKIDLKSNLL